MLSDIHLAISLARLRSVRQEAVAVTNNAIVKVSLKGMIVHSRFIWPRDAREHPLLSQEGTPDDTSMDHALAYGGLGDRGLFHLHPLWR
jgi:hypothetical protein